MSKLEIKKRSISPELDFSQVWNKLDFEKKIQERVIGWYLVCKSSGTHCLQSVSISTSLIAFVSVKGYPPCYPHVSIQTT